MDFSPELVERGYNNRAAVADHPRFIAQYTSLSEAAREQYAPQRDVRYGPNPREVLDLFVPPGTPRGTFVFIHGGYWRALSKDDFSFVAGPMVEQGIAVAVIDYDLCPRVPISTIVDECRRAMVWVVREGPKFGAVAEPVVVAGHSAGGHLAALLLTCRWPTAANDLPANLLAGGLSISGLFDLEPIRQTPFLQPDLRLTPAAVRRLSPAFLPAPSVPLYATVGGDETEEFLRQNELIRDRWGAAAVPVCEAVPTFHHLSVLDDLTDPHGRLHRLALQLLRLAA